LRLVLGRGATGAGSFSGACVGTGLFWALCSVAGAARGLGTAIPTAGLAGTFGPLAERTFGLDAAAWASPTLLDTLGLRRGAGAGSVFADAAGLAVARDLGVIAAAAVSAALADAGGLAGLASSAWGCADFRPAAAGSAGTRRLDCLNTSCQMRACSATSMSSLPFARRPRPRSSGGHTFPSAGFSVLVCFTMSFQNESC